VVKAVRVSTRLPTERREETLAWVRRTLEEEPALSSRSLDSLRSACDQGRLYVAWVGDDAVGWILRIPHTSEVQELAAAYIRPDRRGYGAAQALLRTTLHMAPVTVCTTGSGRLAAYLVREWHFRHCGLARLVWLTRGRVAADRAAPGRLREGRSYLRPVRIRSLYRGPLPVRACCPGCGSIRPHPTWSAQDLAFGSGAPCRYATCTGCGHVWQPGASTPSLAFDETQLPFVRRAMSHPAVVKAVYVPRLRWLARRLRLDSGTRVLDVGCGTGEFLRLARSRYGASCHGVDIDPVLADEARRPGVTVTVGELSSLPAEERFDLITMFHVLEHLTDPERTLAAALERLRPGGHLCVEMPVNDGWAFRVFRRRHWFPLLPPFHRHVFSRRSFSETVSRAAQPVRLIQSEPVYLPGEWLASALLPLMPLLPHPHQRRCPIRAVSIAGLLLAVGTTALVLPLEAFSAGAHHLLPTSGHHRWLLRKEQG
jgi:SAM-dependent methyltransferase